MVKYNSDYRYYSGNLVAVHQNEAFVAFAIMGKADKFYEISLIIIAP